LHIRGHVAVRTSIDVDDALLAEAMAASGLRTKREVVEAGLRLLARQRRQADARELFGRADGRAICIENAGMRRTSPIGPHDVSGFRVGSWPAPRQPGRAMHLAPAAHRLKMFL
jgi:Arc/MetJ family transcription regulator